MNERGYGWDPSLELDLVYNPADASLPPDQAGLEEDYRRELEDRCEIRFTNLLTITNMPLGRFADALKRDGEMEQYMRIFRGAFNPDTLSSLMCRHQVNVGPEGRLYDCDF
ncbi:MAG: DUF3641 domain-containing protein, partial [Candidatus Brocadiia bacterium]